MAAEALEKRFTTYVDALASALAHADRKEPFAAYCRGLILPGDRKSIEPIAARVRPEQVSAAHQSLHHLVAKAARCCRRSGRSPPGSWTTPDFPRKVGTRSGSPGSTAVSWASRTTARSR